MKIFQYILIALIGFTLVSAGHAKGFKRIKAKVKKTLKTKPKKLQPKCWAKLGDVFMLKKYNCFLEVVPAKKSALAQLNKGKGSDRPRISPNTERWLNALIRPKTESYSVKLFFRERLTPRVTAVLYVPIETANRQAFLEVLDHLARPLCRDKRPTSAAWQE